MTNEPQPAADDFRTVCLTQLRGLFEVSQLEARALGSEGLADLRAGKAPERFAELNAALGAKLDEATETILDAAGPDSDQYRIVRMILMLCMQEMMLQLARIVDPEGEPEQQ